MPSTAAATRESDDAALVNSPSASRSDPSEDAIAREAFDDIMEAIARLPASQATAIVMRCVQSESYEVIVSPHWGVATATGSKHVARGRERLARSLRHLDFERLVHKTEINESDKTHFLSGEPAMNQRNGRRPAIDAISR